MLSNRGCIWVTWTALLSSHLDIFLINGPKNIFWSIGGRLPLLALSDQLPNKRDRSRRKRVFTRPILLLSLVNLRYGIRLNIHSLTRSTENIKLKKAMSSWFQLSKYCLDGDVGPIETQVQRSVFHCLFDTISLEFLADRAPFISLV